MHLRQHQRAFAGRAAQDALRLRHLQAQRRHRVADDHLSRRGVQPHLRETRHRQLSVHVHASVCLRRLSPPVLVCTASMTTLSSAAGVRTGSAGATPYLSADWTLSPRNPQLRSNTALLAIHLLVAGGSSCASSNRRCASWINAAPGVDTRSKLLGA
eukprot:5366564-Pleurochrysis_carterae.AAC.2